MQHISIKSVKNCKLSDDGAAVILTVVTKYSGDLDFSLPIACRDELVALLSASLSQAPQSQAPAAVATSPPRQPAPENPQTVAQAPQPQQWQLTLTVPKQWLVTPDVEQQLVVVAFDPQTERQAGYALGADAAKEMGARLGKAAMAVRAQNVSRQTKSN